MAARSELLPDRDGAARFLPWTMAVMVYLAALALAGAAALDGALSRYDAGVAGTATVQLPAGDAAAVEQALGLIRGTAGVVEARALSPIELNALVEPWLGKEALAAGLVLPALIDIRFAGERTDLRGLAAGLAAALPGARLDDHHAWLDRLLFLGHAVRWTVAAIVLAIALAAVAVVVVTTRAGLAQHQGVIEILHLVGARDQWIARRVQGHALTQAFRGGLIGLSLAALTLFGLWRAGDGLFGNLLPGLALSAIEIGLLVGLAPLAALIATVTARLTVMRALARQT